MANKGSIDLNVNALPAEFRLPIRDSFYEVLDNFALGVTDDERTINGRFYRFTSTTPASSNTEFVIRHAIGVAPIQLIPVLTLNTVGAQIVPLKVSRAADATNVYLESTSTSAVFSVLLEA